MSFVIEEINSQPESWRRAVALKNAPGLPLPGERVAVVGCGTSWFIAMAYAGLREAAGQGETDAFAGSEFPTQRRYDRVIAISRSGTTTEILQLDADTAIVGSLQTPVGMRARQAIELPFADERSVVQTRFATSTLALLRASLGEDMERAAADAEKALVADLPLEPGEVDQITFLGRGWTNGLAQEAALKCREAANFWTEAYPAMDYRHGPIAISSAGRAVWAFGEVPPGLADDARATGAVFIHEPDLDPMAHLIVAQRLAVALAEHRGLDPDAPRHLTRSVVLP